jgi:hypothetical protein
MTSRATTDNCAQRCRVRKADPASPCRNRNKAPPRRLRSFDLADLVAAVTHNARAARLIVPRLLDERDVLTEGPRIAPTLCACQCMWAGQGTAGSATPRLTPLVDRGPARCGPLPPGHPGKWLRTNGPIAPLTSNKFGFVTGSQGRWASGLSTVLADVAMMTLGQQRHQAYRPHNHSAGLRAVHAATQHDTAT